MTFTIAVAVVAIAATLTPAGAGAAHRAGESHPIVVGRTDTPRWSNLTRILAARERGFKAKRESASRSNGNRWTAVGLLAGAALAGGVSFIAVRAAVGVPLTRRKVAT